MCVKEGLRDGSPVPLIQREFTNDFEMEGHKFPGEISTFTPKFRSAPSQAGLQ